MTAQVDDEGRARLTATLELHAGIVRDAESEVERAVNGQRWWIRHALSLGMSVEEVAAASRLEPEVVSVLGRGEPPAR